MAYWSKYLLGGNTWSWPGALTGKIIVAATSILQMRKYKLKKEDNNTTRKKNNEVDSALFELWGIIMTVFLEVFLYSTKAQW